MTESAREWTLYVCPECGLGYGPGKQYACIRGGHDTPRPVLEPVLVRPPGDVRREVVEELVAAVSVAPDDQVRAVQPADVRLVLDYAAGLRAEAKRLAEALRRIRDYDGPEEYLDDVEVELKAIAREALSGFGTDGDK